MDQVILSSNQLSILTSQLEKLFFGIEELKEDDTGLQIESLEPWPLYTPAPNTYKLHWSVDRIRKGKPCQLGTGWEIVKFRTPGDVVEDLEISK